MSAERFPNSIADGNVSASVSSSAEIYWKIVGRAFKRGDLLDRSSAVVVTLASPILFPTFVVSAGLSAGLNKIEGGVNSKR